MATLEGIIDSLENLEVKRALAVKMFLLDFHGCGFSPRFSRASGSRGTNHRLQAPRPSGGGSIRRKAFQAGGLSPASSTYRL